jgi:hypothetical protein
VVRAAVAAVAYNALKRLVRRFCGGVRRGSPIPPTPARPFGSARKRNEERFSGRQMPRPDERKSRSKINLPRGNKYFLALSGRYFLRKNERFAARQIKLFSIFFAPLILRLKQT